MNTPEEKAGSTPEASRIHNENASRLVRIMWALTGDRARLNVLTESILLGVGMMNFPDDPRRQAVLAFGVAIELRQNEQLRDALRQAIPFETQSPPSGRAA